MCMSNGSTPIRRNRRRTICWRLAWYFVTVLVTLEFQVISSAGNAMYYPSLGLTLKRATPALHTSKSRHKLCSSKTSNNRFSLSSIVSTAEQVSDRLKKIPKDIGFFYGIRDDLLSPSPRRPRMVDVMSETLNELKSMREEIATLRREIQRLKRGGVDDDHDETGITGLVNRKKRQRELEKIAMEVEKWAEKLLFEQTGEQDGWKEVACQKMFRKKFNPDDKTRCYIKWMPDSREGHSDDDREYPCVKVYATLDASIDHVCAYLSDESRMDEYNDLMEKSRDLEEISPHSKICWGQCPKILFIKPRDLVTFCHHRWLRDGTQVVVNQAVEHPDAPAVTSEKEGKACRAYALRGANFISKDPEDPNKTRFYLLAHANPGGLPPWACKTAVNALAPIEPFKLFYKINKNVQNFPPPPERTEMVSSITGRSARPAGLAQLGYACFWPEGGGLKEGIMHPAHPHQINPDDIGEKAQFSQEAETESVSQDAPAADPEMDVAAEPA